MKAENIFVEFEEDEKDSAPETHALCILSGGSRLHGYLLAPDKRLGTPCPGVIMSHGFPGYTTNNDLELALMRAGCVVIHMYHRGSWGSEGNYLFTNLKEDLIAAANWAADPANAGRYGIDVNNLFLVGHSMGGQSVLNAAKELPFIRGVAALAPYDMGAAFGCGMEKELLRMIETKGQCLRIASPAALYENAREHVSELSVLNGCERLAAHRVLLVEAELDSVIPADKMIRPLLGKLREMGAPVTYETLVSTHSFAGQKMKLAAIVAGWIESSCR